MALEQQLTALSQQFDGLACRNEEVSVEFWYARDLQEALGYKRWENFQIAIDRAIESCETAGFERNNHFREVTKMVPIGSGAQRSVADIQLTRYACYLIAQNGDPKKQEIAFAQCYFALQTRKQELIQDRMQLLSRMEKREQLKASERELSKLIYERGVDEDGFGRIRSKGDKALFGGNTTSKMKTILQMPANRPLADFLPAVTIAAKNLATEITNHNVQNNNLEGEPAITSEHEQNNKEVRSMLGKRGIKPEDLPPAEDIRKLERRVKSEEKQIEKTSRLLLDDVDVQED